MLYKPEFAFFEFVKVALIDVVRATVAAPTFFPGKLIQHMLNHNMQQCPGFSIFEMTLWLLKHRLVILFFPNRCVFSSSLSAIAQTLVTAPSIHPCHGSTSAIVCEGLQHDA